MEIKIKCSNCKNDLNGYITDGILYINTCIICLGEAKIDGFNEGCEFTKD